MALAGVLESVVCAESVTALVDSVLPSEAAGVYCGVPTLPAAAAPAQDDEVSLTPAFIAEIGRSLALAATVLEGAGAAP